MLRFTESFGTMTDATLLAEKWTSANAFAIVSSGGRNGGPYCNVLNSISKLLRWQTSQTKVFMGWAATISYNVAFAELDLYGNAFTTGLFSGRSPWTKPAVQLNTTPDGGMYLSLSGFAFNSGSGDYYDTTAVSSVFYLAALPLDLGQWYYFELQISVDPAHSNAISVEIRVNGTVVYALAAFVDTSGNPLIFPNLSSYSALFERALLADIVVLDDLGSFNTTYLGDVRVTAVLPTADGHYQNWTPDSGTTHFSRVNEPNPDGDTSYVSDGTPGDIDSYAFATIGSTSQIFGVAVNLWSRKVDAGGRTIAALARSASTDAVGDTKILGTNYMEPQTIFERDPNGAAAWTSASLNAAEFGVKLIS